MKTLILILSACAFTAVGQTQNLIGRWQLVKQTTCLDYEAPLNDSTGVEEVLNDMKSMSGPTANVIQFKENNAVEESTKMISKKKSYNSKSFLYKYNGSELYFLDKKSRTIIEGFSVEKFASDSLIISNTSRACETKVFVRIK
jgi:hypothetical protein